MSRCAGTRGGAFEQCGRGGVRVDLPRRYTVDRVRELARLQDDAREPVEKAAPEQVADTGLGA